MRIILLKSLLFAIILNFAIGCEAQDTSCNPVEYWKPYVMKEYGYIEYFEIVWNYIEARFNSMYKNPNANQKASYEMARIYCQNYLDLSRGEDYKKSLLEFIKYVGEFYDGRSGTEFAMNDLVMAKIRTHPESYISDISKIIGPVDDLKKELASHVVETVVTDNSTGKKQYKVFYAVGNEFYVICTITEKSKGLSEIDIYKTGNYDEVVDYWPSYIGSVPNSDQYSDEEYDEDDGPVIHCGTINGPEGSMSVRSTPSANDSSNIIDTWKNGTEVFYYFPEDGSDWVIVRLDGDGKDIGYMNSKGIKFECLW